MSGYAVVDVQTTGLEPGMQHRVVEIAVVQVHADGSPGDSWATLVNPQRDIGASDLHGISARDVLDAPTFDEIAPLLIESLAGRTAVAHNTAFTMTFVARELERAGLRVEGSIPGVATMNYVHHLRPSSPRRLVDCCDEFGIALERRYSSAHQADAVAELLGLLVAKVPSPAPWMSLTVRSQGYPWPVARPRGRCTLRPRGAGGHAIASSWLDRLMSKMPRSGEPETEAYLDMLEMVLLDHYLSAHEADSLVRLAWQQGLDRDGVASLHRDYLSAMARVAWADGVITEDEYADLAQVADALGMTLEDVDQALAAACEHAAQPEAGATFRLETGDAICLTGTMSTPREALGALATNVGLQVGGLTKGTRLLVAADPDSLSGKARKARDYGIPIVNEECFRRLLEDM